MADYSQQHREGYCSHPEASSETCAEKIVGAHTIQKRGGIAAIAEDGHVISTKKGFERLIRNEGEVIPDKVGVNKASTFMGFCSTHDNSLFEIIENEEFSGSPEQSFLFAFRAICYELYNKRQAVVFNDALRLADSGRPFDFQRQFQQQIVDFQYGTKKGLKDLESWKKAYDNVFIEKRFDD